jgi:HSP20 family molecular chaperone IbpA
MVVIRDPFNPHTIQKLVEDFFFSYPESSKPPITYRTIYGDTDEGDLPTINADVEAFEIQIALAGFSTNEVDVFHDDRTITVKGSNKEVKGIAPKLVCEFENTWAVSDRLSLEDTDVTLKHGLLTVRIPVKKEMDNRRLLEIKE